MISVVGLSWLAGAVQQEAFQILDNASGIFYALTYLVMFALPIAGFRRSQRRPPLWLQTAAFSGFGVTLLYCVLSIFPIIQVTSWLSLSVRVAGVLAGANLFGPELYWRGQKPHHVRKSVHSHS